MPDKLVSISEAASRMTFVSEVGLYRWIKKGTVKVEVGPNGRMKMRESEVQRLIDWHNGE